MIQKDFKKRDELHLKKWNVTETVNTALAFFKNYMSTRQVKVQLKVIHNKTNLAQLKPKGFSK